MTINEILVAYWLPGCVLLAAFAAPFLVDGDDFPDCPATSPGRSMARAVASLPLVGTGNSQPDAFVREP